MQMKQIGTLFILLISLCSIFPDSYEDGLDAYREGRNGEARIFLEKAMEENPANDGVYLYLGILYQKEGLLEQAEKAMTAGSQLDGVNHFEITFNLANLYHNEQRFEEAEEKYTYIAESLNPFRTRALLNRANMAVSSKAYQNAINDYLNYLMEEPGTVQKENIEKMVALLRQQLQDEEAQRLAEEERIRLEEEQRRLAEQAEAERLAEEQRQLELAEKRRLEEETRQRALMEEILNSLSTAGDDTKNFTADSEEVEDVFEESDLED